MQFSKIYYNRTGFLFQPLVWNLEGVAVLKRRGELDFGIGRKKFCGAF